MRHVYFGNWLTALLWKSFYEDTRKRSKRKNGGRQLSERLSGKHVVRWTFVRDGRTLRWAGGNVHLVLRGGVLPATDCAYRTVTEME